MNNLEKVKKLMNAPKIIVLLALLLIFALPVFAGVLNSNAAEEIGSSTVNITLITGDTVAVYNISGQVSYSILPGKTGAGRTYQIIKSPHGTYLIPDSVDLKRVDMELFNVDYLINEGYVNLSFIPIMTTFDPVSSSKKGNAISISGMNFTGINKGINIISIDNRSGIAAAIIDKEETERSFNALLENNMVSKVWLDKKRHISLSDSAPLIGAPTLWAQGYNGSGIIIAVIDTGIDASHPDLNDMDDNPVTNDPKVLVQKNFVNWNYSDISDNTTDDLYGHGTHVASIAAGTGEASAGLYKGVAPGAYLWNLRVLNQYGSGYDSWIIGGINYAAYGADGISNSGDEADIISMSLGGEATDGDDPMSRAVNSAVDAGVVVIIAAGNSGSGFTIGTPGAADKVITVGATDKSDTLAYFSSRGPTLDYRVKPDVAAPGVNIVAARASGTSMGSPLNDYYTSASGTSMATPHAAGAAALILQKARDSGIDWILGTTQHYNASSSSDNWIDGITGWSNVPVPNPAQPNNFIAPYWVDHQNISNIGSFSETIGYNYNSFVRNQSAIIFVPKTASMCKPWYVKNVLISSAKNLNLSVYEHGGGRIQIQNASRAQVIPDPATVSFKVITGINTSVIKFYNLNTTSSRTLNLSAVLKNSNGSIVNAAFLNTSTLIIAPNSSASVLLTVNATSIPTSIYSGRITAVADNGEKIGIIFGFAKMNELRINKIKFNGAYASNEDIWVYRTNVTNQNDYFEAFVTTNSSGTAVISVQDGEYNIWSPGSFNNTYIWSTKDRLPVFANTLTTLDERISVPVSFDPNKPNQKVASLFSVLAYSDYYGEYDWTFLISYPPNTTTRVTPTSVNVVHSYEYYPAAYYDFSDISRINTPEWHHLYFSEQGISSQRNYAADYSKLVRRNGVYRTALVNESAWRYEWVENRSIFAPVYWAFVWNLPLPQNRTEYMTPGAYYWGGLDTWDWSLNSDSKSYPEASTPAESWNTQPFSWEHYINRGSNWLDIWGHALIDTDKHLYYSYPIPGNFTLYRNGIKIYNASTTGYFSYYNSSEPGTASYSAVIEGRGNQNLSIRSLTTLNFSCTGTGDYRPPKMFMNIPELELYNRLPGSSADINLIIIEENEFGAVNGTPDQLAGKSLEYSTSDGAGWNALTLTHTGYGEYVTTIQGLANNTFVSLRAKAQDNSGNSASHEIIRAFRVVTSPSSAFAVRDIEFQSLSPGSSTNVTVNITSNITQALSLQENIPDGWSLTRISDDASNFKSSTNEWIWFSVGAGVTKTVAYRLTMPGNASIGTYHINGTISNASGVIAVVTGENTISSDIFSYYRSLGIYPDIVETTDLLKAADDWSGDIAPPGFTVPITTQQLLALADEWAGR